MPGKLSLSEYTLDINVRKCDLKLFDFSEIEDYVRALTGDRDYQYDAIKPGWPPKIPHVWPLENPPPSSCF